MNKSKTYAQTGAVVFGIGNALVNVINQISNNQNKKFDWGQFALAGGKGALFGGAGGFILGTIRDNEMAKVFKKYKSVSNCLHKTLIHFDDDHRELLEKAEELQLGIKVKFQRDLASKPRISGSIIRGTSIAGSDIDIQLPFKRDFGSIENVYDAVSDYLFDEMNVQGIKGVREQKHSIGVEIQLQNEVGRIDIVPTRLIKNVKKDVQMFVNSKGIFERVSYKKTNPILQFESLRLTKAEQRIVRLIKIWNIENNLKIKSVFLERLAKRSFESKPVINRIERDLTNVIRFIASNIERIRIVDIANSNNVISDTLRLQEKKDISDFCYQMLKDIRTDKKNIIDYFPCLELAI